MLASTAAYAAPTFDYNIQSFGTNKSDAQTAYELWRDQQDAYVTETFEKFASWPDNAGSAVQDPSNTAVGSFTGSGGAGTGTASVQDQTKTIVKNTDSEGRNITKQGMKWLDSNDVPTVKWEISGARVGEFGLFNSLAFFLIDGADAGATLQVTFGTGESSTFSLENPFENEGNGNIQFITGKFSELVSTATVTMQNVDGPTTRDGWGVDNNSIARIPVPASIALLGAGLLGVGIVARRRAAV